MARNTVRRSGAVLALTTALAIPAVALAAAPAQASGGGGVQAQGSCGAGVSWKLKAKHDDGRIEVEYEVDSNRVGQLWTVGLTDNNVRVFSGQRRTLAPSGSFGTGADGGPAGHRRDPLAGHVRCSDLCWFSVGVTLGR